MINGFGVWTLTYFIQILTNSSYKLCFYRLWKLIHRTPFTTALRDVKKVLARGQLIVLGPIEAPPVHEVPLGYHNNKCQSNFLCRHIHIATEISAWFSSQNRSNNLSILPDLQSNRISIHSPIISSDILGRSSVLQEILSLVYHLKNIFLSAIAHC